jgi:hypothetical protein
MRLDFRFLVLVYLFVETFNYRHAVDVGGVATNGLPLWQRRGTGINRPGGGIEMPRATLPTSIPISLPSHQRFNFFHLCPDSPHLYYDTLSLSHLNLLLQSVRSVTVRFTLSFVSC